MTLFSLFLRDLFVLYSPWVRHEQTSGQARTWRRRRAPGGRAAQQHEYNPTNVQSSPTWRGSCPLRSPGWHSHGLLGPGPATRPGHTEQKKRRPIFLAASFFPPGWTRRWNRESLNSLAVARLLRRHGERVRGAGESVWLDVQNA